MSQQTVRAIIDANEPPEVTAEVSAHEDIEEFSLSSLPASDLELDGIGFERKTMSDFTSSLLEGRLREQAVKLEQRYEVAYILVEGDLVQTENPLDAATSNISPESLRGLMASLTAREESGVEAVLCCSNLRLLVDMAVRLARKHKEESDSEFLPKGAVGTDEPTTKMMYGCIDGVGPDTASTLYRNYPTIAEFLFDADVESLQELDGIGEKTAEQIMGALI